MSPYQRCPGRPEHGHAQAAAWEVFRSAPESTCWAVPTTRVCQLATGWGDFGDQPVQCLLLPGGQESWDKDLIDPDLPQAAEFILHLRRTTSQQHVSYIGFRPA